MVFSEATCLPRPHIRPVLRLVTEVPGLRSIFTQPVERVTVQNTSLTNAYISDRLYTTNLTQKKDRRADPDMVMVGPSLRLGGFFPLRLDTERLGELYNELERENTLFITRKGLFFVEGTDRNEKDLRFDEARFSLFQDTDGVMRQQEQGNEPVYLYDEKSDMVEYVRHMKTIEYKGMEREVFVSIRFASSFFEPGVIGAALKGTYDPHALRKSLSYTYAIL